MGEEGTMMRCGPSSPISLRCARKEMAWMVLPNPISSARMPFRLCRCISTSQFKLKKGKTNMTSFKDLYRRKTDFNYPIIWYPVSLKSLLRLFGCSVSSILVLLPLVRSSTMVSILWVIFSHFSMSLLK